MKSKSPNKALAKINLPLRRPYEPKWGRLFVDMGRNMVGQTKVPVIHAHEWTMRNGNGLKHFLIGTDIFLPTNATDQERWKLLVYHLAFTKHCVVGDWPVAVNFFQSFWQGEALPFDLLSAQQYLEFLDETKRFRRRPV